MGTAQLSGTNPTDFRVTSDHCSGADLAPGAACTFDVSFTPSGAGRRTGTLTFAAGDGLHHAVALSGSGS